MSALEQLSAVSFSEPLTVKAHDGGELSYDGVCYDYRDQRAQKGIKLWLPPGKEAIRSILFFGNPGSAGDTRDKALNKTWQDWAAQRRMGVAGVTWFRGGEVYHKTGADILAVFKGWAEMGYHPELATIPFVPRGSSNAGMTAYGFACYAPERMLCFTSNVGARYNPLRPPAAALKLPALQHIGPVDRFMPLGLKDTAELYMAIRRHNPLWAWDAEEGKGHQDFSQLHIDLAFYSEVLDRRLPYAGDDINEMTYESGWLADTSSWQKYWPPKPCMIAAYADYKGESDTAVWLPGEKTARAYQAAATYRRRVQLTIDEVKTMGPADGQWNINDADLPTVDPGQEFTLRVQSTNTEWPINWQRIEFFNGNELIGTIKRESQHKAADDVLFKTKAHKKDIEQVFTVLIYDNEEGVHVANPFAVVLRNAEISAANTQQMEVYNKAIAAEDFVAGTDGLSTDGLKAKDAQADVLYAHALNDAQSSELFAGESLPDFWQQTRVSQVKTAAHAVQKEQTVSDADASMDVRAVYCRAGLALLVVISDDQMTAHDGLDWHCSWQDPRSILTESVVSSFLVGERDLLCGGVQYQLQCAALTTDALDMHKSILNRNIPRGGLLHQGDRSLSLAAAEAQEGIRIRSFKWSDDRIAMQWFLPWSAVGIPAKRLQPKPGTELSLLLGLNDRDSDGSAVDLRWPYGRDPWHSHGFDQAHEAVWGVLHLGHALITD